MRWLRRVAYPAVGLLLALGVHTAADTPTASAQCRFYYGTTNANCYDEELDSEPCIWYYGTQNGCRSRWNTTTDESQDTSTTPAASSSGPTSYGQGGPMYGPPPGGVYGPGYGAPPPPYYYGR